MELPPGVCDESVSGDSCMEMTPGVCDRSVSGDSCMERPPEQQEIM